MMVHSIKPRYLVWLFILIPSFVFAGFGVQLPCGPVQQGSGGASCSGNEGNESAQSDFFGNMSQYSMICYKHTISCTGTPASASFIGAYYELDGSREFILAVYTDNSNEPYLRKAYTTTDHEAGNESAAVITRSFAAADEISAGDYWICSISQCNEDCYPYYSSTTGGVTQRATLASYAAPADASSETWSSGTQQTCIYMSF